MRYGLALRGGMNDGGHTFILRLGWRCSRGFAVNARYVVAKWREVDDGFIQNLEERDGAL